MKKHYTGKGAASFLDFEQRIFKPKDNLLLKKIMGPEEGDRLSHYPYTFLVYLKADENVPIICISGYQNDFENLPSFKKILSTFPVINFNSLLFLATVFGKATNLKWEKIAQTNASGRKASHLDDFFKESFGQIVYAHQLEQLYCMLTGCNYMEAITFRKDWNLKRPIARSAAKHIEIADGLTLANFLDQRTLDENQFVYNANFGSAYHILKAFALKKQTSTL